MSENAWRVSQHGLAENLNYNTYEKTIYFCYV